MEKGKLCKLRDIYRQLMAFEQDIQQRHGLNMNEAMLVCTLGEQGVMTAGDMGTALGLTPSNTSKVIASVERHGLVRRSLSSTDRRLMQIALTAQGKRRLEALKCTEWQLPTLLREIVDMPIKINNPKEDNT